MNFLLDPYSIAILIGTLVVSGSLVFGIYMLVQWKQFGELEKWAGIVVNSVQQTMKLVDGPRKKELALLALRAIRDRLGAKATDEELEMLIEANVHVMKNLAAATPITLDDKLVEAFTAGVVLED